MKRVRELEGKRTARSTFYRLADGRTQVELSSEPVRYRGPRGKWHAIDTEVTRVDKPGFAFGNKKNAFRTFFGSKPDQLVRFTADKRHVTFGVPDRQRGLTPEVRGDTVTYADVFGDADLVYRVTPAGLKEKLVLEQPPADGVFAFTVRMGGVTARKLDDGSIGFFRRSGTGGALFRMPKPFMLGSGKRADSPVGRAYSNAVTQSVQQRGSRATVTLRANEDWLNSPDREYPVVIDPTIEIEPTPTAGQDTMIDSNQPDANFGSYSRMSVGTTTSGPVRGLVKFDLSGVPDGVNVDAAQLRLYFDQTFTTNDERVWIHARRATAAWDEDTVTWNSFDDAVGERGRNRRRVDNAWDAQTSWTGAWPSSTSSLTQYAVNGNYQYNKDCEPYEYYSGGTKQSGSKLTNPKIIDKVASVTNVTGRTIAFTYSDKGLLKEIVDGSGASKPKDYLFTYDATNANKNTKLVSVTDPRENTTDLAYYEAPQDPKDKWLARQVTDRRGKATSYAYVDPDGSGGDQIEATVTDPQGRDTSYLMDGFGRPIQTTNAKSQTTTLAWDDDHNVTRLEEDNGAVTTWSYDSKTGYPLSMTTAKANANGTAATTFSYAKELGGHVADLVEKVTPQGRTWAFGYDPVGNLTSVTDPKGTSTPTSGDYTTTYAYDSLGQRTSATDAEGNTTTYRDFGPHGFPREIENALSEVSTYAYNARGNVTGVTDAAGHTSSYTYDHFGRPMKQTVPKTDTVDIVTPAPDYDPNGNVVASTAPNGAVTTYGYNPNDQVNQMSEPDDGGPARVTNYWYNPAGRVTTVVEPKGNLTTGDPGDYVTDYQYNALYELTSVTNAAGHTISYSYDNVGNLVEVVDPKKTASADTGDFTTRYDYDLNHRVTSKTDAAGESVSYAYDLDGNVTAVTDRAGRTTQVVRTERALVDRVKVPHTGDGAGGVVYRVTDYGYDQNGRRVTTTTPRGVATAGDPDDFAHETVYDPLGRVKRKIFPYDPDDARYNSPRHVAYSYDAAGNLAKVSAPASEGSSVRNDTTYEYFHNGWIKNSTDPWGITTAYDYNALGQQTTRTLTSAGGSASRTMGWSYHPSGLLAARSDEGIPAGLKVALVDNTDTPDVTAVGTWPTTGSGVDGEHGRNYRTHASGSGGDTFTWTPRLTKDGDYEVFVRWAGVSGAASNAAFTVTHQDGSATTRVDQSRNAGQWVSLGTFAFTESGPAKVRLSDDADGTVVADAVKLVRDNSGSTDSESKDFAYAYDANRNLTEITDSSPGAEVDRFAVSYTGLNQVGRVREYVGGAVDASTSYGYDANGNPVSRDRGQRSADYSYNPRDLVTEVATSTPDGGDETTTYSYTARGQKQQVVKPNGNTVDHSYFRDGLLQHKMEQTGGGALVAEHTLEYQANGHRSRDAVVKMNADDGTRMEYTKAFEYDPRGRIREVTKTGSGGGVLETESYVHDAAGNVISQTVDGTTTSYGYERNRLLTASTGGATASYSYDPFGRLTTVTSGGQTIESYSYDGFSRVSEHSQLGDGGGLDTTVYAYDPLDRTLAETTEAGTAAAETTEFDYLGLTGDVLTESVAGDIQRSYTYAPWGRRLSQVKHNSDGSTESSFYGYTPGFDVGVLTGQDGDTRATYGYTAYGSPDTQAFTGVDKPDPQNPGGQPYNLYRYNAKRWNPTPDSADSAGQGSYDMGFRRYNPGLNRFLTRDLYTGALADQNLTTNTWTANRYAFGSGNPVTNIELDGHSACAGDGTGRCVASNGDRVGDWTVDRTTDWTAIGNDGGGGGDGSGARPSPSPGTSPSPVPAPPPGAGWNWNTIGHGALDAAGLFAGPAGAPFDAINCGWYGGQGKAFAAGASCLGAIPIAGIFATGGKYAGKYGDEAVGALRGADELTTSGRARPRPQPGPAARACNCFVAGTLVATADGPEPIEDIDKGDKVWARDPATGEKHLREVTGLFHKTSSSLHTITTRSRDGDTATLKVTGDHPFWVDGHGWTTATDLQPGDRLLTKAGDTLKITHTTQAQRAVTVYNFEVAGTHNYHVLAGDTPILVHNCELPLLKRLHPEESLDASALNFWRQGSTEEIVESLRPGGANPLRVKPDGTVMDGNTRAHVLEQRGFSINSLPRVPYRSELPEDGFWD